MQKKAVCSSEMLVSTHRGIAKVGQVVRPPWAAESKGRKNGQQNEKKNLNFCTQ
jgi:hypothetical protein